MKAIEGFHLITPDELVWRPSNLMRIPNADFLERTGSQILGARLWRLPPQSANTLHKPRLGGVLVGPSMLRQIFNDTDSEVLWLIAGAPEAELEPHEVGDMNVFYPVDPTQLPPELKGVEWPPKS
jgi:hypothetical protein